MYDLAIIGAGPAGYVAAERAAHKGFKTIIFDKRELGGVCLNEGCIPTKTLLYSAKIYDSAKDGKKYGVLCDNVNFDFSSVMARKDKVVKKLVGGVSFKMKSGKVEVVKAHATIKGKGNEGITIQSDKEYQCKNVLICTGSEAFVPPIKGLSDSRYLTNREVLQLKEQPKSINIIGGGVIGIEFASFFASVGTKVTVVEMMDHILPGIDSEISKILYVELEKKGVEFHLSSKVTEVKGQELVFEKEGKSQSIKADELLVCVGRKPNIEGIGIENLNIETFKGGIKIDKHCRTNVPNVYAAGDVTGFSLLAHTASREAEVAVNHMLGRPDVMRYNAVPGVVYTNPEVSGVGLTEEQAKKKKIKYKLRKLPMSYAGRFVAENEGKNGLAKVLVGEEFNEVLGVHMIGNPSSEMIYGAAMAIEAQLRLQDMEEVIFPHPTVSEIFKETIFSDAIN